VTGGALTRLRGRLAAALGLAVVSTLLLPQAPANAAFAPPGFVRAIGGRGEAGVYAWGLQYNPVTNQALVGDYWNFQIRAYDTGGTERNSFFRPANVRRGQPYSLGVDPRDGAVYVPEISDGDGAGYVAKYDKNGNYLYEFDSGAAYNAWITVDSTGALYIADSHYWNNATNPSRIRKYVVNDATRSATQVASWGTWGSGPGQMGNVHGLATDAANNVYVADATNRNVHVFSSSGSWIRDFGAPGNGVGEFTGDLRGLTVDATNGWVYVVDAEAAQVEKFTTTGTALLNWGSEGSGPGQMADGGRQIDVDGSGNVLVADYGNYRVLKFSPGGTLIGSYPDPAAPPPAGGMAQVRDVAVDRSTGEVWVADSWNNRFQKFAADGSFLGKWGQRNSHPPYGMNYPRGIARDPSTGNIWVADTREHVIRVYDADVNYLFTVGSVDSSSTGNFRWPMDMEFAGTKVWVADYNSGRVKRLNAANGAEELSFSRTNNGLTVDPVSGNVFVVSWSNDRVYRYSSSGLLLGFFGSSGSGDGQFQNPWDIDLVGGQLYVTDAQLNRVQVFTTSGSFVGKWGTAGVKPGQFNNPSGIDHDAAGNIYVADAGNDRIQVFSTSPVAGGDTTAPTVAVTTPTANAQFPAETVWVEGTAADNVAVGTVETALFNRDRQLWWNAKLSAWTSTKTWNLAQVRGSDTSSIQWRFPFNGPEYGGRYYVQARSTDVSGTVGAATANVNFTVAARSTGTPTPPETTLTQPLQDAVVTGNPVTIAGEASDDTAVASVAVSVRDRTTNLWWNATTGTWGSALANNAATLGSPGAAVTAWSYAFDAAAAAAAGGSGSYFASAQAADSGGTTDPSRPSARFTAQ
jgi:DNA-binding beta-propeller fold protein YncE